MRAKNVVYSPQHPVADASGHLTLGRLTLYEKIGPGSHPCHWCGVLVSWKASGPDKLKAALVNLDGPEDDPANVVPACPACVGRRSDLRTATDEPYILKGGRMVRAVERRCAWCNEMFLHPKALSKGRRGLYCSGSCRNYARWS